ADGVSFGYDPPPPLPVKRDPELPVHGDSQYGTAFTLDFPGVFHIKAAPDKLEYEILITSDKAPTDDFLVVASGLKDAGKPHYKVGKKWPFLPDAAILKNATIEGRHKRTSHAFRNTETVTLDLAPKQQTKRFYFLLSPVQLGPDALKFAMSHPKGLTPLLR